MCSFIWYGRIPRFRGLYCEGDSSTKYIQVDKLQVPKMFEHVDLPWLRSVNSGFLCPFILSQVLSNQVLVCMSIFSNLLSDQFKFILALFFFST